MLERVREVYVLPDCLPSDPWALKIWLVSDGIATTPFGQPIPLDRWSRTLAVPWRIFVMTTQSTARRR
jgi:hypothetical protein